MASVPPPAHPYPPRKAAALAHRHASSAAQGHQHLPQAGTGLKNRSGAGALDLCLVKHGRRQLLPAALEKERDPALK